MEWQLQTVPLLLVLLLLLLPLLLLLLGFHTKSKRRLPLPPGPTGWPVLGSLNQLNSHGPPHATLQQLARRYGPLIHLRLGTTPTVVASSPAMAEQVMRSQDVNFCNRPSVTTLGQQHMAYGGLKVFVWANYCPRWRMIRKLCVSRLFSAAAMAQFRSVRHSEVAALVRSVGAHGESAELELKDALSACSANVLSRTMMGQPAFPGFGVKDASTAEFREAVTAMNQLDGALVLSDFVPWLRWLDPVALLLSPRMKRVQRLVDAFLGRIVDAHLRSSSNADDFLGHLLSLSHAPGVDDDNDKTQRPFSMNEKKALLSDLFTAGTDTTGSTTEWAMAELMRNPELMRRVKAEIDGVVGRERVVSEDDLREMPLLSAVVKETLRIHPPTPLLLPREAAEESEIAGFRIPKGARVIVNAWAIQRDPAVWPEPLRFLPERFLETGGQIKGGDFRVIPFGAGRRICVGMSLALCMVEFLVASLVHSFDWSFADEHLQRHPESLNMEEEFGLTLQRLQPLRLLATPRLLAKVYSSSSVSCMDG